MPRSKSSQKWLNRQNKDPFVQRAKEEGLRGRASFKLKDIEQKYRFLPKKGNILDLGAAPGSWSVYLSQYHPDCQLVACDLLPMDPIPNVQFIQGDFMAAECQTTIEQTMPSVDIIICDMAPNATGQSKVDQWRAGALTESVLAFCQTHLHPQGHLLIKLFHGSEFEAHLKWLRVHFKQVNIVKPPASRKDSSEVYALARSWQNLSHT